MSGTIDLEVGPDTYKVNEQLTLRRFLDVETEIKVAPTATNFDDFKIEIIIVRKDFSQ